MLFEGSGIDPAVAEERGYRTARSRSEVPDAFANYQRRLGLVVPMFSPDGTSSSHQLRPDKPRSEELKYESPAGSDVIIDVHPRMLEEVRHGDGDLWVVEGVKKADALVSRGVAAVALSGVWMAHVKGSKGAKLLPCWDHVNTRRRINVGFDSDWRRKPEVHDALRRVVGGLEGAGADVRVAYLEDAPDGSKVGVDDYLVAGGTVRELGMLCGRFEAQDVARNRLSRDARLRAGVENLERRWWAEEWKGRGGHSDRDLALVMIAIAAESGKIHADGIRFKASWGVLQVKAKVARRTLAKSIARLEERGFCYRDKSGQKADKTGAFVLRANVDQSRGTATQATQKLRACNPYGLPLRGRPEVPRLRWPVAKWTPKRGLVRGTRRVRQSKRPESYDAVDRLGKIRGAVVDAVEVAGGSCTLAELCNMLHRKRPRDVRRRVLPMLEEAGIVAVEGDRISLTGNWSVRLEAARATGGETSHEYERERVVTVNGVEETVRETVRLVGADDRAEMDRRRKSRDYHRRGETAVSLHPANNNADGFVEDLEPPDPEPEPELVSALREFLRRHSRRRREQPSWLAVALWADGYVEGKPTPAETAAALEHIERNRRAA